MVVDATGVSDLAREDCLLGVRGLRARGAGSDDQSGGEKAYRPESSGGTRPRRKRAPPWPSARVVMHNRVPLLWDQWPIGNL